MKCRQVQFLCIVGAAAIALVSCGGSSHGAGGSPTFQCGSDAGGEATLSQVAVDGGVGIEQYLRAMSIARCNYWNRCFGMAPYVANECVDALVAFNAWPYSTCAGDGSDPTCTGTYAFYPATGLLQAVAAGTVQYDPQRSGQCVAALLAQGCANYELVESIPACSNVFTCATDAGSGGAAGAGAADAGADAGGADAGVSACAVVLERYVWYPAAAPFLGHPEPLTCSTATDCADAGPAQYCLDGFCSITQCEVSSGGCTAFAQVGQPCVGNALSIVHWDDGPQTATENCAPGLSCSGAVDGGVGACVTPQDVGGACTRLADCESGLACACGICQIPPSAGPCADGLCKVGVAYCDFGSNLCQPVHALGDSCSPYGPLNYCGSGLSCSCNPLLSTCTCQPPN